MKPPTIPSNPIMLAWYRLPGVVYFFKAGAAIKIGVTAVSAGKTLQQAVKRRMTQLQSANHEPIELLGVVSFSTIERDMPMFLAETLERELHIRFASSQRFKRHTVGAEWFTASTDLLAYIRENAQPPEVLGLPRTIAALNSVEWPPQSDGP
jgi:T5orf172 domain